MDKQTALAEVSGVRVTIRPLWLALILAAIACSVISAGLLLHAPQSSAAALAKFVRDEGVWDNRFNRHLEKARALDADLAAETDSARRIELKREIAEHYLLAGQVDGAIDALKQLLASYGGMAAPAEVQKIRLTLALAYLRYGELRNCTWNHSADSCLFPIQQGGIHQHKLGAQQAIAVLAELLADPGATPEQQLSTRWLFNVAHMAAGTYPGSLPRQWLLPPEAFASAHAMPRFRDVATPKGVAAFGLAGGAVMDDFDNDGHLDLLSSSWGNGEPLQYFRNRGDGHFDDRSATAIPAGINGGLQIVQADYDNDGLLDLLILRGAWLHEHGRQPRTLLHNEGNNRFTDVTAAVGLSAQYPTQAAAWADYDGDGLLDLIIGNEIARPDVAWPAETPNFELYRNTGKGGFDEVGASSGLNIKGWVKGLAWGDTDNDGRPDLYVSVMGGDNQLFRNLGTTQGALPRFEEVTAKAGVAEPRMSFACWFWDFDNDGWLDLFVAGYASDLAAITRAALGEKDSRAEMPRLYRNNRDGTFTDVAAAQGLAQPMMVMGSNYGDLDNDGWADLYLGTGAPGLELLVPNRMFHNHGGKYFDDVTTAGGFGHLQKGHGVAWGDIDNDGDQDIYEDIGGAFDADGFWNVLFENPGTPGNHWLTLRLQGTRANRFGIGSRVRVRVVDADGSERTIHHLVGSGGSFGGNSVQTELGLGAATVIKTVEIDWAGSGLRQTFQGLAIDRVHRLVEGEPVPKPQ